MDGIIYLEPDEEITSVIDKLKALTSETKAVSLVIPKGAAILRSVVNLKLLKKEAEILEKELALITQDRIGRNLASQAGFTVYDRVGAIHPVIEVSRSQPRTEEIIELDLTEETKEAKAGVPVHRYDETGHEAKPSLGLFKKPPSEPPESEEMVEPIEEVESVSEENLEEEGSNQKIISSPKRPRKKIPLLITGICFLGLAILWYLFYPRAIIFLTLATKPFEQSIEIAVDNNIVKMEEERQAIPGDLLEVEQEKEKKFTATGKKEVGEKAKGTITVSNESGNSQKITTGTEFKSASNLVFKSSQEITVPGATASVDAKGNVIKILGKVDVSVEAAEPGDQYNLSPTSFSVIGYTMLSSQNNTAMSGGLSRKLTIVTQNDLNNAKSELAGEIAISLHEELKKKTGEDKIIDSGIKDDILTSSADKEAGAEAEEFTIKVKVKSATISFKEEDYRQMIVRVLEHFIPQDKELVLLPDDEVSTLTAENDLDHGLLKLEGIVKTRLVTKLDQVRLKQSIKGKDRVEAEEIIKEIEDVETVTVFLRPKWWLKKVPALNRNIEIKFEYK